MTVDLLPLPPGESSGFGNYEVHDNEAMIAYAKANVARAVAPLQAEIKALRAEIEALRTEGAYAIRYAPSSAYWSDVLKDLFGPNARDGIDALEARRWAEIERANTAEVLLWQALEAVERALEAMERAHQTATAMEQTLQAGIPERAEFARIAQDLDFAINTLRERLGEEGATIYTKKTCAKPSI